MIRTPDEPTARRRMLYILSPSYSGSTLLTLLLGAHPEIATIGELKAQSMGDVDRYVCSCGRVIRECPFFRRLGESLSRRGMAFDPADFGTHFRDDERPVVNRLMRASVRGPMFETARTIGQRVLPASRRRLHDVVLRNEALIEAILALQGGSMFLDGSKDPNRLKFFWDAGRWEIKVVCMIRDGRGTSASFMKHEGFGMERAAFEWRRTCEEMIRLEQYLPRDAWMMLKYEDLCRDIDARLRAAFDFAGLRIGDSLPDPGGTAHHVIGNTMRLAALSDIRLDETWRERLTADELTTFKRVAGALNRRYGYMDPPS